MAKKRQSHKQKGFNPYGHYRKAPNQDAIRDFSFTEIDGIKVLDEPSNSTATVIRNDGPALERELIEAMTYSQRSQKRLGHIVAPHTLRQKFPAIDKYCDDDQVTEIACSEPGKINPHQHSVYILSERLQISVGTVDRYFRNATLKKTEGRAIATKPQKS
jgi:hypothetical protein